MKLKILAGELFNLLNGYDQYIKVLIPMRQQITNKLIVLQIRDQENLKFSENIYDISKKHLS